MAGKIPAAPQSGGIKMSLNQRQQEFEKTWHEAFQVLEICYGLDRPPPEAVQQLAMTFILTEALKEISNEL
jgi:hypothetical protein